MDKEKYTIQDLEKEKLAALAIDMFHRTILHHVLWFREVEDFAGPEKAVEILEETFKKSWSNQIGRLGKHFDFQVSEGIPQPLLDMNHDGLMELLKVLGVNWLAGDGIWFQEVEKHYGIEEAKKCNQLCWARFSPLEAAFVKKMIKLPESPGISGLRRALGFRLYGAIAQHTVIEESENSILFQMNECRVQSARKRKNMDDYHCKSSGLVEHTAFAAGIDARIKTECVACPPDEHPEQWYCCWRFYI